MSTLRIDWPGRERKSWWYQPGMKWLVTLYYAIHAYLHTHTQPHTIHTPSHSHTQGLMMHRKYSQERLVTQHGGSFLAQQRSALYKKPVPINTGPTHGSGTDN